MTARATRSSQTNEVEMAGLEAARPIVVVCTRDRERAVAFYRDVLGLPIRSQNRAAVVFDIGGTPMHLSTVADFAAHDHTILGFRVPNVTAVVRDLAARGVVFNIPAGFTHDHLGVVTVPGTAIRVAWFKDPDGNTLSVTDV
jgi:catechol 2,3-dioxygenase-like lactoylglutathione lyase family enzyme